VTSALHLPLALLGLVAGAAGAAIGWQWPSRRALSLPLGVLIALDLWTLTADRSPSLAILASTAAMLAACFLLTKLLGVGHGAVRPLVWLPVLALPLVAAVYLSVPDTEGSVVLAASLVPVAAGARAGGWRGPRSTLTSWTLALVVGITGVAVAGAADRFSLAGWAAVKVALLAVELVLIGLAVNDFRSSEPVRPPP
jgi:hypothetical protein